MRIYTTVEAAEQLSKKLRRKVTSGWVLEKWRAMHGLSEVGIGHRVYITGPELHFLEAYGRDTYARPNQPGPAEWAAAKGVRVPKRYQERALAVAHRQPAAGAPGDGTKLAKQVQQLAETVHELTVKIRQYEIHRDVDGDRRALRALPSPSPIREKVRKSVASWAYERTRALDYRRAWTEVYREFWHRIGGAPREWYESQLENENKLDFFERYGSMDLLCSALPDILVGLSRKYPTDPPTAGEAARRTDAPAEGTAPAAAHPELGL
jgi:hypothetical protein